jgi:hypothetical protein
MTILGTDRSGKSAAAEELRVDRVSLAELLERSDVVLLTAAHFTAPVPEPHRQGTGVVHVVNRSRTHAFRTASRDAPGEPVRPG